MKDFYESILFSFERRYRLKKLVNLCITAVIAVLGITSLLCGLQYDRIPTIFRWMTVDGTVFTTVGALVFVAVNLRELLPGTEMTRRSVYFLRLSSAAAEAVIFTVVWISQLPFLPAHIPFAAYTDPHFERRVLPDKRFSHREAPAIGMPARNVVRHRVRGDELRPDRGRRAYRIHDPLLFSGLSAQRRHDRPFLPFYLWLRVSSEPYSLSGKPAAVLALVSGRGAQKMTKSPVTRRLSRFSVALGRPE